VLDRGGWARKIQALGEEYGLALDPWALIGNLSVSERQRIEIINA